MKARDSSKWCVWLSVFLFGTVFISSSSFAQYSNYGSKASSLFVISKKPPHGFESLVKPLNTMVDVYYQGRFVKTVPATYTPTSLVFAQPEQLVKMLPGLSNRPAVALALSGHLNAHANYICAPNEHVNCKIYSPNTAGVVFNANIFRVDVYVNKKYVAKAVQTEELLPASTAGYSVAQGLSGTVAGDGHAYSMNLIDNMDVGYKNAHLNAQFSYSRNINNYNGYYNPDYYYVNNFQLSALSAEVYKGAYKYAAGFLETQGNLVIPNINMVGVSASTTLDTVPNLDQSYGSKLMVFLAAPSQVSIYKDGRLVATGFYQAGNQVLNTSSLPQGAYEVTLNIRSVTGVVTQETRFFAKTTTIPPLNHPLYFAYLGFLQDNYFESNSFIPSIKSIPIYQLGMIRRLSDNWGISGGVIGTNKRAYVNAGFFYIGSFYQIEPQVFFGTAHDYGVGVQGEVHLGRFNGTLYGRRFWMQDHAVINSDDELFPVTANSTQGVLSLAYAFDRALLKFNANVNKPDHGSAIYSYGPGLRVTLLNYGHTTMYLNMDLTKSQSEAIGMVTFTAAFAAPHISATGVVGQRFVRTVDGYNDAANHAGTVINGEVVKDWYNSAQDGLEVGARAASDAGSRIIGGHVQYINGLGHIRGEVINTSGSNAANNTQYSLEYDNRFVWAQNHFAVGGARSGNTGIIVDVKSKVDGKFEVLANGHVVKVIKTNKPTPIFLQPFKTYDISLREVGKTFFAYSQAPRTVTLYNGNFAVLNWEVRRQIILFAHLLNSSGKPLANTLVQGGVGYNATDENGYLQGQVLENVRNLTMSLPDGSSCSVNLPVLHEKDGLAEVGDLVCHQTTTPVKAVKKPSAAPSVAAAKADSNKIESSKEFSSAIIPPDNLLSKK